MSLHPHTPSLSLSLSLSLSPTLSLFLAHSSQAATSTPNGKTPGNTGTGALTPARALALRRSRAREEASQAASVYVQTLSALRSLAADAPQPLLEALLAWRRDALSAAASATVFFDDGSDDAANDHSSLPSQQQRDEIVLGRRLAAEAVFLDAACALCSAVADDAEDRKAVASSSSPPASSPPSSSSSSSTVEAMGLSDRQASALEALCFDWAMRSSSFVPAKLSALAGPRQRVVSAAARTLAALARCSSHNGIVGAPVVLGGGGGGGGVQPQPQLQQPPQQQQQPTTTTVRLLSISARFHSELMERLHADPNSAQRAQLLALCEAMSLVRLSFGPRIVLDEDDDDGDETSNQKGDHLHYHHGRPRRRNANDAALSAATVFVARAHPLRVRAKQRKSQVSRALAAALESVLGALCDGRTSDAPFAAAPSPACASPSSSSSSSSGIGRQQQQLLPIVASSGILERAVRSGSVSAGVARAWHEEVATLRADVAAWCSRAAKHSRAGLALVAAATCLEDDARFREHAPSTAHSLHKALKDKATRAAAVRGIARLARALTVARPGLAPPGESKPCRSTWLAALAAPAVSIILKKGGSSVVVPAGSEAQIAAAAAASEAEASAFASALLSSASLAASLPVFPTAISAAKGGALDCERALLDLTLAFAEESPQLALDAVALELLAGTDPASAGGVDAAGVGATATLAVLRKSSERVTLSTAFRRRRQRRLDGDGDRRLPRLSDPLVELVAARLCPFVDAAGCSRASLARARRGLGAALAHVELPLAQYRYPLAGCVKPPPAVYSSSSSSASGSLSSSSATAGGATSLAAALGDAASSAVSSAAAAFAAAAAAAAAASLSAEECGFACGGDWASVVAFASVSSSSSSLFSSSSSSAFASALPPSLAAAVDLAAAQAATPAAIARAQAAFAPLPLPQVLPPPQHSLLLGGGGTVGGGSGGSSTLSANPNFSPMPRERLLAASLLAKVFACVPAVLPDRWPDADRAVEELPAWTLHADRDGVAAAATAALRRCVACLPRATVARAIRAVATLVLKIPDDCPDVQTGTLALACDLAARWEVALADGTAALEDEELVAMAEGGGEDDDDDDEEEEEDEGETGDGASPSLHLPPLSSTEASALDALDGACLVLLCSGVPRARCAAAAAARAARRLGRALASSSERTADEARRRKQGRSPISSASSARFSAPPVRLADVIDASGNALAARCCWDWGLRTERGAAAGVASSSAASSFSSAASSSSVRWSDLVTAPPGGGSDVAITRARWVAEVGRRAAALAPGIGAVASRAVFARVQLALGRDARAAAAGTSILGNGSGGNGSGGGGSGTVGSVASSFSSSAAAAAAAAAGGSSGFGIIVMTGGASLPLSGSYSSSSSTSISVSSSAESLLFTPLLGSTSSTTLMTMNETAAREAARVDALASLACLAAALPPVPVSVASSGATAAAGASTASAAAASTAMIAAAEPAAVATPPPPSVAGTTSSASSPSPVSRAATAAPSPSQGGNVAAATAATAGTLHPGSTAGDVVFFSGGSSTRRQKQQHRRLASLVSFSSSSSAAAVAAAAEAATSHRQPTAPSRPSDLRLAAFNLHPHRSLFKALSLSLRSTPEAATRWAAPALAHASLATLELLAEALRPLAVELAADKPRSLRSKGRRDESRAAAAQVWRLLALSAPSELLSTAVAVGEDDEMAADEGAPALRAGFLSFVADSLRWLGGGGGGGGTGDLGFGVSGPALAGDASTECQAVRLALASVVRRLASVDAMASARAECPRSSSSSSRSSLFLSKPLRRALFDAFDAWRGASSQSANGGSVSKSSNNSSSNGLGLRGDVARVAAAAKAKYGGGSGDALAGLSAEAVVFKLADDVEEAALEAQAAMLAGPSMDEENEDSLLLSLSLTSSSSTLLSSKRQPAARALAWAESVLRCDDTSPAVIGANGTTSMRAGAAVVAGLRNALAAQPYAAPFYIDAAMSYLCFGSSPSSSSSSSSSATTSSNNNLARRGEAYATAIADVYSVIDLASSSSSSARPLPLCSLAAFALFGVGALTAAGRRAASRVLATLEAREWGKKRRNGNGGGSIAASVAATLLEGGDDGVSSSASAALDDAGAAAQLRLAEGLAAEHPELALPLLQECTSRLLPLAAVGRAPAGVLAALSPLVRRLNLRKGEDEKKKEEQEVEEEGGDNNDDEASPSATSSSPYPLPTNTCSATISCLLSLTAAMGDQGRKAVDALWVAAATSAAGKERKSSSRHHRGNASAAMGALVSAMLGGLPDVPRPPECDAAAGARALAVGAPLEAVAALVGEAALALCCCGGGRGNCGGSSIGSAGVLLDEEEAGEDVVACESPAAAAMSLQQQQLVKQQRRLGRPSPVSVSADATTSFAASAAAGNAPTPPPGTAGTRRPPLHPSSRASPAVPSRRAKAGAGGGSNAAPSSAADAAGVVAASAPIASSPLLASDPRARAGAALWLLAHAVGHVAVDARNTNEEDESDLAVAAATAATRAALAARAPVIAHAALLALATGWPGGAARGARAALAALVVASSAAEADRRRRRNGGCGGDEEEPNDEPASAATALADSVDAAAARLQRASEAASRLPAFPSRLRRASSSSSASYYHLCARRAAAASALRAAISEVVAAAAPALPSLALLSSVTTATPADAWAAIALRCALARPPSSSSSIEGEEDQEQEEGEENLTMRGEAAASHAALRALAPAGAAVVAPALAAEVAAAAAEAARESERGEATSSSSSLLAVRSATRRVARAAGSLAVLAAACPSARPRALAVGLASIVLVASSSAAASSAAAESQSPSSRLLSSTLSGWGMRLAAAALEQLDLASGTARRAVAAAVGGGGEDGSAASGCGFSPSCSSSWPLGSALWRGGGRKLSPAPRAAQELLCAPLARGDGAGSGFFPATTTTATIVTAAAAATAAGRALARARASPGPAASSKTRQQLRRSRGSNNNNERGWVSSWSAPRRLASSSAAAAAAASTPLGSPEDQLAAALFAGLPWAIARARCSSSGPSPSLAASSSAAASSAGAASAAAVAFLHAHADAAEGIPGLEKLGASLRRLVEAPSSEAAADAALREAVEGLIRNNSGASAGSSKLLSRRRRSEALRLCGVTLSSPAATTEHRKASLRMLTAVLRFEAAAAAAGATEEEGRCSSFFDSDNEEEEEDATVALSAAVASLGGSLGDEGLAALRAALSVKRISHSRREEGKRGQEEEENALPFECQQRQRRIPPPSTPAERAALAVDALARVSCAWPTVTASPVLEASR